jgi:hypothetical protein
MSYISAKQIVQKIIRDYNIINLGWVVDSNDWIREAIQYIGTNGNKIMKKKTFDVTNIPINLPCDLEDIVGIVIDGCYVRFQGALGMEQFKIWGEIRPYVNGMQILFNKDTNVKGDLYYYSFVENCDDEPMMVNHIKVTQAVTNYVLLMLMQRGMKHPVLDYTTVYQLWNKTRDEASNYLKFPAPYEINFVLSEFINPMD